MPTNNQIRSISIVTNSAFTLSNFRGPLIRRMVDRGIRVYALAPDYNAATRAAVEALGAEPVDISLDRTGMRIGRDVADIVRLARTFRRLHPDLVFCYFIKPVIYGTIAAWLARVPRRYSLVAGLGYVFARTGDSESAKRRLLRSVVSRLYRTAFSLNRRVFLQNDDDLEILCDSGVLKRDKAVLLNGTGVDLEYFAEGPPVTSPVTFILVARLLREKGIVEYVDAARRIKAQHPNVRFLLVGAVDENPAALRQDEVRSWVGEGLIEWPGRVSDVREWLANSSVFVLPSYYREGKPRSTQEALALGRPVITTDAPGCRDTVVEGVNGFKIPVRNSLALEAAMRRFIDQPELIVSMGKESRQLARELFNVHEINALMFKAMEIESA